MEFLMLDHCEFGSFGFFLIFRQHLPRDFSFQYEQIEWFFTTTITVVEKELLWVEKDNNITTKKVSVK